MDERPRRRPASEPAWVLAAIGWIAGNLPLAPRAEVASVSDAGRPAPHDLTRMAPRELRRVPGIGEGHAIAIARARWEHPPDAGPLYLDDVYGIGPAIHDRVRAWLDRAGAARGPQELGRPSDATAEPARGAQPPLR